jgi:hypothetical protein
MRKHGSLWVLGAFVPLMTGCFLLGARPTEVPLMTSSPPGATTGTEVPAGPATVVPTEPAEIASPTPQETAVAQVPTPLPTATPVPSPAAEPTWPPGTTGQAILLELPVAGQSVGNPLTVRGRTRQWPFEGTLVIHVYDARDQLAAEIPIITEGDLDGPTTFEHQIPYGGVPGVGRVEVTEFSAMDGSVVARASVNVTLSGLPGGGYVESPAPLTEVTLPIKLLARVGRPNEEVRVRVTWDDVTMPGGTAGGESFEHVFRTLAGQDGRGLLIVPLDVTAAGFRHPQSARGHIEIRTLEGGLLALQPVRILHPDDPDTVAVQVFWARNEALAPQTVRIPRTPGIARAALEALLWGPVPGNQAGYDTFIPTPEQILAYPGRDANWGERIEIRSLTIRDGVAYADFSIELSGYSGGALPSIMIREQIKSTLTQFSTVNSAVVTVNGVSGVLEP